ncbi:MAG: hypothetical protein AAF517_27285, partial [Planctomycetota bacterium]
MELLKLLRTQLEKGSVGTLLLGESTSFREIFFERENAFLCGHQFSGKIDVESLIDLDIIGNVLSPDDLEMIQGHTDLTQDPLPLLLRSQGRIDAAQEEQLVGRFLEAEVIELFLGNGDTFHFQHERVPETLLDGSGPTASVPIPLARLIDAVETRQKRLEEYRAVLPSGKEVFVPTAEGMAHMQESTDYALKKLFGLVDGFRNLETLVTASSFYEVLALGKLVDALDGELLKKTVLPEIKHVTTSQLDPASAEGWLPSFKNAVKHAVDPLEYRERLAELYECVGDADGAVVQYNFIGDSLYRMKKPAKAIAAYQRALDIKADDVLVTDKITRIYQDAAEQELANGDLSQAITLLENALTTRPDDQVVFQRLTDLLTRHKHLDQLSELLDRVIAHGKRLGDCELGVAACRQVLANVPRSATFQKKLINIYLDFQEVDQAAEEMANLARTVVEHAGEIRHLFRCLI